ncbi:MAG: putative DNA-binding transcriptional regulator [Candidatus Nitrosomirales archaeon]
MGAPDKEDTGKVERELKGKTLQVYVYMLKKKEPVGVREIQRDLNFSSPSVANYHIEKLVSLNVVSQDEYGRYFLAQKAQISVLESFVNVGGRTIPRMSFFAAFFTTLLVAYIVLNLHSINIHAVGFAIAGAAAFWFETVRVWRRRLF